MIRSRRRTTPKLTLLAAPLLVIASATAGLAGQDTDDQQSALEDANALVARLAELDAAIARLGSFSLGEADDIEGAVRRRTDSYNNDRRSVVWDLSDLLDQLPADDAAQRIATMSDSLLIAELERLEADAVGPYEEGARLRAARTDTAPGDLLAHELRLGAVYDRLGALVSAFVDTVERIEARGLPVPDDVAQVDRFLFRQAELGLAELDVASEEKEAMEAAVTASGSPADGDTQARVAAANSRFEHTVGVLAGTLDLMDRRGLGTTLYREELVLRSGSLSRDNLNLQVVGRLINRATGVAAEWLGTNGASVLFRIGSIFVILFLFRALAGFAKRLARRGLSAAKIDISRLLQDTFVTWTGRLVMFLGVLIALSQLGFNLGPLLAGLGVAGFIVGFALQDTLSNFAAGLMILIYRPFDVDDLVEAGGQFGKVAAMSLVSTTILSLDNQRLVVPNNQIWGGVIRNMTAEKIRRVDLVMGIGYSDDIPKAEATLNLILAEHPLVLDDPAPIVKLQNLGDSSVDFVVRPWCKTADYWDVHWDVTRAVKMTFDDEGISIPFPQRDVHVFSESTDNGTVTVAPTDLNPNAGPKRANPDYSGSDQGTGDS